MKGDNPASMRALRAWKMAHIRPLAERFWEKVRKTDGCWFWDGATDQHGYGQITDQFPNNRRRLKAHRLSLQLAGVDVPPGKDVCHHCDNPNCVRPDHLFIGDAGANMHDCISKGRFKFLERRLGTAVHNAKLTPELVREARQWYRSGVPRFQIAKRLGVSFPTINRAIKGETWQHVSEQP